MPTTGVTRITTTHAMRDAGSRCGHRSARRTKAICSITWIVTSTHPCNETTCPPFTRYGRRHPHLRVRRRQGPAPALVSRFLGGGQPDFRPVARDTVDVPLQAGHV